MSKHTLSIGKYRALQRASTENGIFTILAIDHLDSLRRALHADAPQRVTDEQMTQFKQEVVLNLMTQISGVLLDPVYSAGQLISEGLDKSVGLLVELEKADYEMNPLPLAVDIRPHWSVEKIKRMGADGVKLFYYYDPDDTELCAKQNQTLATVIEDCSQYDIPLYAEPIMLNTTPDNRTRKIYESAKIASELGADILKLEFPVDVTVDTDISHWRDACMELSSIGKPWVLLSAGVAFDVYCQQVEIACQAGASGFMAGRAVWGDVAKIEDSAQRLEWLQSTGIERISRLSEIAMQHSTPWTEHYLPPQISPSWHENY
ncbi:MAG: tagatose 1,6-diphosphate aldolase [Chloroflexota bacterium]